MTITGAFRVSLTLLSGKDDLTSRVLTLDPDTPVAIGRSSSSAVKQLLPLEDNGYVNSPVISRHHAQLTSVPCKDTLDYLVKVKDEGSMHGTFINGLKLIKQIPAAVFTGDIVRFGADVNRGNEIFKAPEFRVKVEKLGEKEQTQDRGGLVDPSTPHTSEKSPAKGGFYVPDSDSDSDYSPDHAVCGMDYYSDVGDGDDDSRSSASVGERSPLEKSMRNPGPTKVGEVRDSQTTEPVEIFDVDEFDHANLETIVIDDDISVESDLFNGQEQDTHDADSEDRMSEYIEADYSFEVASDDDDDDDDESAHEESFDAHLARESSVESEESPSVGDAPLSLLDGPSFSDKFLPALAHLSGIPSSSTTAVPDSTSPQQRSILGFFEKAAAHPTGSSSTKTSDALPDAPQQQGTGQGQDEVQLPAVATPATTGIAQARAESNSMTGGSKKRSFDAFVQDLVDEAVPPTSSLSNDTEPPSTAEAELQQEHIIADTTEFQATMPSTAHELLGECAGADGRSKIIELMSVHEPPQKRARLQSVVRTAGTVLASAVAGGVATFYALGLTPESVFA